LADRLDEKLRERDGGRILDVATGKGVFLKEVTDLLKSFDHAVGIDQSEKHIAEARKEHESDKIKFKVMDAYNLDFDDNSFDMVTVANSLHHFNDPQKIVWEMYRVLKPGGLFLVYEMVHDSQTEEQLTHVYMHHWWAEIDTATGIVHNPTFDRDELTALIGTLDFTKTENIELDDLEADPKDKKTIDWLNDICDQYIGRAKEHPELAPLADRGEQIKERLRGIGIHWATEYCILGRKTG